MSYLKTALFDVKEAASDDPDTAARMLWDLVQATNDPDLSGEVDDVDAATHGARCVIEVLSHLAFRGDPIAALRLLESLGDAP